jgi:hypothetical protein
MKKIAILGEGNVTPVGCGSASSSLVALQFLCERPYDELRKEVIEHSSACHQRIKAFGGDRDPNLYFQTLLPRVDDAESLILAEEMVCKTTGF